jgi:nicotinic acid mononucleotide adenylyltransferase
VSSTAIREACHRGEDASRWVPPDVWSYIGKHKLYS